MRRLLTGVRGIPWATSTLHTSKVDGTEDTLLRETDVQWVDFTEARAELYSEAATIDVAVQEGK